MATVTSRAGLETERLAGPVPADADDPPVRGAPGAGPPARPDPRGLPHLRRPGGDRRRRLRPPAAPTTWSSAPTAATATPWPRGSPPRELIAELFGRATGCSRGRGGSMHLFAPEVGMMGTSGIVGPCILQAAGAGYSFKLLKTDRVAVAFFGDGAVNNGAFHEGLNMASIWKLPVLFVCENNQFATEVPFAYASRQSRASPAAPRPTACPASRSTATTCWPSTRPPARPSTAPARGGGPTLLECKTYRTRAARRGHGRLHATAPARRSRSGRRAARSQRLRQSLLEDGADRRSRARRDRRRGRGRDRRRRTAFAEASPWPDPATAATHVYAEPRRDVPSRRRTAAGAGARDHLHAGDARSPHRGDGARTRAIFVHGRGDRQARRQLRHDDRPVRPVRPRAALRHADLRARLRRPGLRRGDDRARGR